MKNKNFIAITSKYLLIFVFLISFSSAGTCYQETANQSTAGDGDCGLNYSGSYDISPFGWEPGCYGGLWLCLNPVNTIDVLPYVYVTYNKPAAAIGAIWYITWEGSGGDIPVPSSCFNKKVKLQIISKVVNISVFWDNNWKNQTYRGFSINCWNYSASAWIPMAPYPYYKNVSDPYHTDLLQNISVEFGFLKEAMIWNFSGLGNEANCINKGCGDDNGIGGFCGGVCAPAINECYIEDTNGYTSGDGECGITYRSNSSYNVYRDSNSAFGNYAVLNPLWDDGNWSNIGYDFALYPTAEINDAWFDLTWINPPPEVPNPLKVRIKTDMEEKNITYNRGVFYDPNEGQLKYNCTGGDLRIYKKDGEDKLEVMCSTISYNVPGILLGEIEGTKLYEIAAIYDIIQTRTCSEDNMSCVPAAIPPAPPAPSSAVQEENKFNNIECTSGCGFNGKCINKGMRVEIKGRGFFCDNTLQFQKPVDAGCFENYECVGNLCSNGKCVSVKAAVEERNKFSMFIVKMVCKISSFLGINEYEGCIASYSA